MNRAMLPLAAAVFLCFCGRAFAGTTLNIQNDFGYTIVDVGQAMDINEYNSATGLGLSDYDQFNYRLLGQLLVEKSPGLYFGVEAGLHRLYYWEETYKPLPTSSLRWRYGTIWTVSAGGLVKRDFGDRYYAMTGLSLHNFLNGSGMALGLPFALGHRIKISEKFEMPVEFRADIIFGSGTPIAIGGGVGLQFDI